MWYVMYLDESGEHFVEYCWSFGEALSLSVKYEEKDKAHKYYPEFDESM